MKKLVRSKTDKIFLGVCGGLGEYFEIDSSIIRFIFLAFTFVGGSGILLYFALAIIMPNEDNTPINIQEEVNKTKEYINNMFNSKDTFKDEVKSEYSALKKDKNMKFGLMVLLIGFFIILSTYHLLNVLDMPLFWGIYFILIGLFVILKKNLSFSLLVVIFLFLIIIMSIVMGLYSLYTGPVVY